MNNLLNEDSRSDLISKSKRSQKGNQRFKRRTKSHVANSVKEFNSINMNKLFKDNILSVNINVRGETNDYVVRISFGGFLDILHDELKRNNDTLNLKVIVKSLITGFNKDDVFINCSCPDFCLTGDNKIKLLNGEVITIAEMLERFSNGEQMYVYSTDDKGDFKPGKVTDVWVSGYTDEVIEITLDNGEVVTTTPNHRYMCRDGSYKRADELSVGQALMPSNTITDIKNTYVGSVEVYDLSVDKYNNFMVNAGVVLHNCYRFGYWATRNKIDTHSLDGRVLRNKELGTVDPQDIPSNITNPNDTLGSSCKHVLLVLSNNSWLMKVASVIYNYIRYMEKNYQRVYADVMYPAIYQKPYEEPVQMQFGDTGRKYAKTGKDTLNKANKQDGRDDKGRFAQGNRSGRKFAPSNKKERDPNQMSLFDDEEV